VESARSSTRDGDGGQPCAGDVARGPGAAACARPCRTTITGHDACTTQCRATDPRASPASRLRLRCRRRGGRLPRPAARGRPPVHRSRRPPRRRDAVRDPGRRPRCARRAPPGRLQRLADRRGRDGDVAPVGDGLADQDRLHRSAAPAGVPHRLRQGSVRHRGVVDPHHHPGLRRRPGVDDDDRARRVRRAVQCRATEPSSALLTAPRPRLPTTSSPAPSARATSASAGPPGVTVTCTGTARSRATARTAGSLIASATLAHSRASVSARTCSTVEVPITSSGDQGSTGTALTT
jgi:hypothetical protein